MVVKILTVSPILWDVRDVLCALNDVSRDPE